MNLSTPLQTRSGPDPRTTTSNPHTRLDQQPSDLSIQERLAARLFTLPGVAERPSAISVRGHGRWPSASRARDRRCSWSAASSHALHPAPDFSLHAALPRYLKVEAIEAGASAGRRRNRILTPARRRPEGVAPGPRVTAYRVPTASGRGGSSLS